MGENIPRRLWGGAESSPASGPNILSFPPIMLPGPCGYQCLQAGRRTCGAHSSSPVQLLRAPLLPVGSRALCRPSTPDRRYRVHTLLLCVQKASPTYLITSPPIYQRLEAEVLSLFSRVEKGRKAAADLMSDLQGSRMQFLIQHSTHLFLPLTPLPLLKYILCARP